MRGCQSIVLVMTVALVSAKGLPHSAVIRRLLDHNDDYLVGCNRVTYSGSEHSFTSWQQPDANTFVYPAVSSGNSSPI